MKVQELINNLQNFVAQSPENAHAEIRLQFDAHQCYGLLAGNDARGIGGLHFMILLADKSSSVGVRELRAM